MRKIIGLGIAVLVVVVLWIAGWFWAAGEARQQVALLAQNDGETAPQLTCGTLDVSGFPFRFDVTCGEAEVITGDETLTVKGIKASVLVYSPTHVIFSAIPPYTMANAFTGSQSRVDFTGLEGSARLEANDLLKGFSGEGWRIARISVVADGLVWNDTVISDILQAKAAHLEAQLVDIPHQHDKAKGIAALAAYFDVKGLDAPGFEIAAGDGSLEAQVSGLPNDLRNFSDPDLVRRWQQAGGALKLIRLAGRQPQPDERFEISGTASLGDTGLVNGQISYTTKGVLDRFAKLMPPLQLLALKGKPEADGGFSNGLNLVDGQLKLIAIPLLDIPPLF